MKTRNLIYLAQLEEYDLPRIKNWLKDNPHQTVPEIKHHLKWTPKTILIFIKTSFLSLFLGNEKALFLVLKVLTPIDSIIKNIFINLTTIKFKVFNKNTLTIGITGSWGKTTTKEIIYSILKSKEDVTYTPSNHNTLLAIAKQILKLSSKTKIFVCEMGAYQVGDIQKICSIVHPKIGILTALGPMHLERFGNLKNILQTKMELAKSLPKDGIFFAPKELVSQIKNFSIPDKTIYFQDYQEIFFSLGKYFDIPQSQIKKIISSLPPAEHRRQIIKNGDITVIDDTYNSNPAGFRLALSQLKETPSKEKILVTPGMIELGELQSSENQKIGKLAANICSHIIVIGQTNRESLTKGIKLAERKIKTFTVPDLKSAQEIIPTIISKNSAILFENDLPDHYF